MEFVISGQAELRCFLWAILCNGRLLSEAIKQACIAYNRVIVRGCLGVEKDMIAEQFSDLLAINPERCRCVWR